MKDIYEMERLLWTVEKRIAQKQKQVDVAHIFNRPRYVMQLDALKREASMLRSDIEKERVLQSRARKEQEARDNARYIFHHDTGAN